MAAPDRYTLSLGTPQLDVIQEALDLYMRLQTGQLFALRHMIPQIEAAWKLVIPTADENASLDDEAKAKAAGSADRWSEIASRQRVALSAITEAVDSSASLPSLGIFNSTTPDDAKTAYGIILSIRKDVRKEERAASLLSILDPKFAVSVQVKDPKGAVSVKAK